MSIFYTTSESQKVTTIKVIGQFDFSQHAEFRNSYRSNTTPEMTYLVELSETDYMDSSALGMLMLLKEHAESYKGQVALLHPSSKIRKLLATVRFEKLFRIVE